MTCHCERRPRRRFLPAAFALLVTSAFVLLAPTAPASAADAGGAAAPAADPDNGQWAVVLDGFFPGEAKNSAEPKRLNCYLVRRAGMWTAALATATNSGRPNWNTALMLVDPSGATFKDN